MQEILNDSGKLIFVAISFMAVSEFLIGVFLFLKAKNFMDNSQKTMGTITNVQMRVGSKGGRYYALEVDYKDRMGRAYKGNVSQMHEVKEGEQIELVYHKEKPDNVKTNNLKQIYLLPVVFTVSIIPLAIVLFILVQQGVAKFPF